MSASIDEIDSLELLLPAFWEAMANEQATAFPGRIESYDAASSRADVVPMVQRTLRRDDGSPVRELLPTLRHVKVLHPRWGSWFLRAPLTAGDFVLVLCCDRDPSRFLATGDVSPAPDDRLHHLAHAVCLPLNFWPSGRELGDSDDEALLIGRDGGEQIKIFEAQIDVGRAASDFVVLKGLNEAQLTTLKTAISATVVVAGDGGASFKTTLLNALSTWPGNTGASKVRAE